LLSAKLLLALQLKKLSKIFLGKGSYVGLRAFHDGRKDNLRLLLENEPIGNHLAIGRGVVRKFYFR
jgi:hypothetical protein